MGQTCEALIIISDISKVPIIIIIIFITTFTTTIIIGPTEYSGLLSEESGDTEKQPHYRMMKNYVLTRGLVTLTGSSQEKRNHSNYFNKENVIWGGGVSVKKETEEETWNTKVNREAANL